MRIEAVSGLRGEGLLHDFALDVVHGVAVAVHDHAARGAEDGGAALATVRSQAVAALALPDDGFAPRELEAGFLGVGELPVIVEVIAAADRSDADGVVHAQGPARRSEEHTSELQSQSNLVCRLLLEKKNTDARPAGAHQMP